MTDPNASGLECVPANGSPLAPGASLVCTASHTVTQADIDAGHYFNQACVNASGVDQACDDVDVPSAKNPALTIVKNATEANYDSVGDVIHYTITATNTGNTTLAAVTVTDPNARRPGCASRPTARRSRPAPIVDCTATHTVTQADIDAGHYLNTACVDDGQGGADQVCDDADVPRDKNPDLGDRQGRHRVHATTRR